MEGGIITTKPFIKKLSVVLNIALTRLGLINYECRCIQEYMLIHLIIPEGWRTVTLLCHVIVLPSQQGGEQTVTLLCHAIVLLSVGM